MIDSDQTTSSNLFRALQSGLTSSGEVRGYIGSQLSTRNALELKFIQDTNLGNVNNYAQINLFAPIIQVLQSAKHRSILDVLWM